MALYTTKGRICEKTPVQSGTSRTGNPWQRMTLVIEVEGYQGSTTRQAIQAMGDAVDVVAQYNIGDKVEVSWSLYAREWEGKWYNNVDLVRIKAQDEADAPVSAPAKAPAQKQVSRPAPTLFGKPVQDIGEDDLPF